MKTKVVIFDFQDRMSELAEWMNRKVRYVESEMGVECEIVSVQFLEHDRSLIVVYRSSDENVETPEVW
jgi:hypothetical protein